MTYYHNTRFLIFCGILLISLCGNINAADKIITIRPGSADSDIPPLKKGYILSFGDLPRYAFSFGEYQILLPNCNNNRVLIYNTNGGFIKKLDLPETFDDSRPTSIFGTENSGNCFCYHNYPTGYKKCTKVGSWNIAENKYEYLEFDWKAAGIEKDSITFPNYLDGYIAFSIGSREDEKPVFNLKGTYICNTNFMAWSEKGIGALYKVRYPGNSIVFCFTKDRKIDGEVIKEIEFFTVDVGDGKLHRFLGFDREGIGYFYREDYTENNLELSLIRFDPFNEQYEVKRDEIPYYNGIAPLLPIPSLLRNGVVLVRFVQPTQPDAIDLDKKIGMEVFLDKPNAVEVQYWKIKF